MDAGAAATARAAAVDATVTAVARQVNQSLTATALARPVATLAATPVPTSVPFVVDRLVPKGGVTETGGLRIGVVSFELDATTRIIGSGGNQPAPGFRLANTTISYGTVLRVPGADAIKALYDDDFKLIGTGGKVYATTDFACGNPRRLNGAAPNPEGTLTGEFCIRVPLNETNLVLVFDPVGRPPSDRRYFAL